VKNHEAPIATGFLCCVLFSFHLEAAVYTYNATIDISTPWSISHAPGLWEYAWLISAAPTFAVQPGDTVQGTISFAGNQALQFLGPVNTADLTFTLTDSANTGQLSTSSTTTLNGVTGPLTWSNPTSSSSAGGGDQFIAGFAGISTPTAVSFEGFSYSTTVLSGSGHYTPYSMSAYTDHDVPGAISVIPEPSVAGLIALGLIILSPKRRTVADD
jgi:hypothetical protein